MSRQPVCIIIDGNALVHRAFHGMPPLATRDGTMVNAVYGFVTILLRVIKDFQPDYMAVTFDLAGPTFRHEAYKEYKAQRKKQPDELYDQIPIVKEVVQAFQIPIFEKPGFEADDMIGTLTAAIPEDIKTVVVTGDLDTLQLIDDHTFVYTFKRSLNDTIVYDAAAVHARYGLQPHQMIDYKTLRGDASDNIPGVPGIGEKTASELLQKYGTIEKLEAAAEGMKNEKLENLAPKPRGKKSKTQAHDVLTLKLAEKIVAHAETIKKTRQLVTIVRDVPIDFDLEKAKLVPVDSRAVVPLFQKLEFKSLLARMMKEGRIKEKVVEPGQRELFSQKQELRIKNQGTGKNDTDGDVNNSKFATAFGGVPSEGGKIRNLKLAVRYHLIQSNEDFAHFLGELKKQTFIAIDTETTGIDAVRCMLLGISVSWKKGEAWYVPVGRSENQELRIKSQGKGDANLASCFLLLASSWAFHPALNTWNDFAKILARPDITKTGHNIKYDLKVLLRHGLPVAGVTFDSMIASYLLNPGTRAHSLDSVAFAEFGYQMQPLEELIGPKGKNQKPVADVPLADLAWYAAEDADFSLRVVEPLAKQMEEKVLRPLFDRIEIPLIPVLVQMEIDGAKIDVAFLKKLQKKLARNIAALDKKIQDMAGVQFNVNSPVQLKDVLFNQMKISAQGVAKIKTGLSTAASELEKLQDAHPIIPLISEYRELTKLQSTYVEALPAMVNPATGRIHTNFNQTIAATGRLSSTDPNLQNIPVRTELGREIRRAFVADVGYELLSIDYSQIELRIVASLANDPAMIASFASGEDIHRRTAADIQGIALEKVTADQRRAAKEVNFGVLYGMGAFGLAARTGLSHRAAADFIQRYFAARPRVKEYLQETVALARQMGYVETLFGRRRYVPDINSGVAVVRAAAERTAVNMPIQGTAADLLKLAMILVGEYLHTTYDWGNAPRPDVRMILTVHDELVFEVRKPLLAEVAAALQKIMEAVETLRVPITTEVKSGTSWGALQPLTK